MEKLKQIFAPKVEVLKALPKVIDKNDGDFVVIQKSTGYELYIMINGTWKKVSEFK